MKALENATFGDAVHRVSLKEHQNAIVRALYRARLLIFPRSFINDEDLASFVSSVGSVFIHPDQQTGKSGEHPTHRELMVIFNEDGIPWHFDGFFEQDLKIGISVLKVEKLPEVPTFTIFCDMEAVYRDLPPHVKDFLKGKRVWVDAAYYLNGKVRDGQVEPLSDDTTQWPGVAHQMVQTNTATGNSWLCLGAKSKKDSARILDVNSQKSRSILTFLWAIVELDNYHCAHKWEEGDAVAWNNQGTMHAAPELEHFEGRNPQAHNRVMHRASVLC